MNYQEQFMQMLMDAKGSEGYVASTYYSDVEKDIAKLEPAWAKMALYFRCGVYRFGHCDGELRCKSLEKIKFELDARRKRVEAGDKLEILAAVAECAKENMPMPTWLATAFIEGVGELGKAVSPPTDKMGKTLNHIFARKENTELTPKLVR